MYLNLYLILPRASTGMQWEKHGEAMDHFTNSLKNTVRTPLSKACLGNKGRPFGRTRSAFLWCHSCFLAKADCKEGDDGYGMIVAGVMNQNGMGASLHAPKGPAEQEVVVEASQGFRGLEVVVEVL